MKLDDLRESIAIEIELAEQTLTQIVDLQKQCAGREPTVHEIVAFSAYVREIYQGCESIMTRVAKFCDVVLPDTANWHLELLTMFSDPPTPGLPLFVSASVAPQLAKYRGFRHVFTKRYSSHLQWTQVRPLAFGAAAVFGEFAQRVIAYLDRLDGSTS